ncbi:MAG TPA: hypothetical protein VJU87_13030 [Gemmatimonadaceae bacterium]|nr:hypothetical protein [Gemmatimonadaceae bacterium]
MGCLFILLLVAVALYFGVNVFEAYWRFYQYQDAMNQEVRFAAQIPDDRIKLHLTAIADSLGLPPEASDLTVQRQDHRISVSAEYTERVDLPVVKRDIHFAPHAEGTF